MRPGGVIEGVERKGKAIVGGLELKVHGAGDHQIKGRRIGPEEAVDIGGYYHADPDKTKAVMRPSETLNAALASFRS